ncbi:MAG: DNA repair protein RecN, partial [Thermoanaerobaculia bacterium]|nr:DNA repair protein RecN [Thermoanaerobaculia bacterium]
KSIVVDTLSLLAGARASSDLVRTGAETLTVSGVFEDPPVDVVARLDDAGVAVVGDQIVVRREINRAGRNRIYIDDQPVTLRLLSEIAPGLLRIHGQREELGLVQPELQRTWLDRRGGDEGSRRVAEVAERFAAWAELEERLQRISGNDRIRQERIDLLTFQLSELESAALEAGEEDELRQERDLLRHSEAIFAALGGLTDELVDRDGSISERLAGVRSALDDVAAWESRAGAWSEELDELRIRAQELARSVADRLHAIDADPERLAAVEDRLAIVERMCRKYGPTAAEALERQRAMRAELDELRGDGENRDELEAQVTAALASYRQAAAALSAARRGWADELCADARRELAELALEQARLDVRFDHRPRADSPLELDGAPVDFAAHGVDRVTYLFSPNPGEDVRPLSRVASGGELSRLYLALQLVAGDGGKAGAAGRGTTLVFDEVDSGVGGVEAVVLGRKLRRLAARGQILCVTHLPQVASQGDHHLRVTKSVRRGRTWVGVEPLDGPGRVEEIARKLGGEAAAAASRAHAEEMLAEAGG